MFDGNLLKEIEIRHILLQNSLSFASKDVESEGKKILDGIPELISIYKSLYYKYHVTYDPQDFVAIKNVLLAAKKDLVEMNNHLKDLAFLVKSNIEANHSVKD